MAETVTSTVPGALEVLLAFMENVVTALPDLDMGTYLGIPIGGAVANNYIAVGAWDTGELLTGYKQDWMGFPAAIDRKSEVYGLPCTVRAWQGDVDPPTVLTNFFLMVDGIMSQLQADPQALNGTETYALTPSGSWQATELSIPTSGPLGGRGWGMVGAFTVQVNNVRLTF